MRGLALALLLAPAAARAGGGPGTSIAPVFKFGAGARAAGMGNSFVSVADDVDASAWNPAGLALVDRQSLSFMHFQLYQSVNYEYMSYAHPVGAHGGLGAHAVYLYTDPIERTAEDATGSFDPGRSGGAFRDREFKLNGSAAYAPLSWLALGVGGDYYQDNVAEDRAEGFMGDAGVLAAPLDRVRLGASVQNVGPPVHGSHPPTQTRLGAHWLPRDWVTLATEYDYQFDSDRKLYSVGAEVWPIKQAALRSGYQWGDKRDPTGNRWSMGAGMWLADCFGIDYAFSPVGELGQLHLVSLVFAFGPQRR